MVVQGARVVGKDFKYDFEPHSSAIGFGNGEGQGSWVGFGINLGGTTIAANASDLLSSSVPQWNQESDLKCFL